MLVVVLLALTDVGAAEQEHPKRHSELLRRPGLQKHHGLCAEEGKHIPLSVPTNKCQSWYECICFSNMYQNAKQYKISLLVSQDRENGSSTELECSWQEASIIIRELGRGITAHLLIEYIMLPHVAWSWISLPTFVEPIRMLCVGTEDRSHPL